MQNHSYFETSGEQFLSRSNPNFTSNTEINNLHASHLSDRTGYVRGRDSEQIYGGRYQPLDVPFQRSILLAHELDHERQASLERRLERACTEITKWEQKYNKLKEDFEYNLSLIQGRDKELEEFERQNEEQKLEIKLLQQKISRITLDEQCKNLLKTTQSQEETNIKEEFQRQIDNLRKQLEDLEKEKINIEQELKSKHESKITDIREEHENEIRILKQNLNQQNKQLEEQMQENFVKIEKLEEELERCKLTVQTKGGELQILEKNNLSEMQDLKRRNLDLEREKDQIISTYQIQIEGLMSKIQDVQDHANLQEENNTKLRKDYEMMVCQVEKANELLKQSKQTVVQEKEALKKEMESQQELVLEQQTSSYDENIAEREKQIRQSYEIEIKKMEQQIQHLQNNVTLQRKTWEEKLNSAQRDTKKLLAEVDKCQHQNKLGEKQLREAQIEAKSLRKSQALQTETFVQEKENLVKERDRTSAEHNDFFKTLLNERDKALNELRELKLKINLGDSEKLIFLETRVQNLEEIINIQKQTIYDLKQEKIGLQNAITKKEHNFVDKEKISIVLKDNEELSREGQKLQKENGDLFQENKRLEKENLKLSQCFTKLTNDMEVLHEKSIGQDYKSVHDEKLELESKVDGLVRYCDMMQRQLKESITGRSEISTDQEIKTLRGQVHKAHEIIRKNEKEKQKVSSVISELHSKIHGNERLIQEINSLKVKEADYRTTIRQLKDENNQLMKLSNRKLATQRKEILPVSEKRPSRECEKQPAREYEKNPPRQCERRPSKEYIKHPPRQCPPREHENYAPRERNRKPLTEKYRTSNKKKMIKDSGKKRTSSSTEKDSSTANLWLINERLQAKLDALSGKEKRKNKRNNHPENDLYDESLSVWLKHRNPLEVQGHAM